MGRHRVLFAAVAAMLVAMLAWRLLREPEVAILDATTANQPPTPGRNLETSTTPPTAHLPDNEPRREAAVAATEPSARQQGLQLRVRLRGLHAEAPWTSPLLLDVEGRDEAAQRWLDADVTAAVDSEGLATFALPDWCATATDQKARLTANDPNYQELAHRWHGAPDLARELVVDVQVTGGLVGRVVDASGGVVPAARVVAYALRGADPVDGELASTNTRIDGSWSLAVPPGVPLWLLAVPMQKAVGVRSASGRDGVVMDNGQIRSDLLPAATAASARIGAPTTVPDLVLPAGAQLTGHVRWSDGEAIPEVWLEAMPGEGTTLALSGSTFVQRHADGRLSPGAQASTDEHGDFVLPAVPGASTGVRIVHLGVNGERGHLVGPRPTQAAIAPQHLEFVVPRPTLLRARRDQETVAGATIEIGGQKPQPTDRRGELALVPTATLRVRASHERLRSPWREFGPGDAGTTIDLELQDALTPITVEFDGDFRVRNTVITWRRDDGLEGREHLLRDDRSGPFELFLEPGRYRLTAGPGGGERNGVFLLPSERDVDIGAEPVALRLRAVFGGSFTVMATNSSGVWVGGTCQLLDSTGADVTDRFRVQEGGHVREGRPGELLPDGTNAFLRILPPGDYELLCDFGDHGAQRQRFAIKPREVSEVRIRLP